MHRANSLSKWTEEYLPQQKQDSLEVARELSISDLSLNRALSKGISDFVQTKRDLLIEQTF